MKVVFIIENIKREYQSLALTRFYDGSDCIETVYCYDYTGIYDNKERLKVQLFRVHEFVYKSMI